MTGKSESLSHMCGFIATLTNQPWTDRQADRCLVRLRSRGPDGEGRWRSEGVFLGHRRLAILDLDPRAAQPMHSSCGRYSIVFNGEVYNFRELKQELERDGVSFRTTSDTEVILALFVRDGESMLERLKGMFAFVIWDGVERRAFAARDPYGIKPLYMARIPGGVALASQVKALLASGLVDAAPDIVGQSGFWMLGSVPEPHTWYRNIKAVRAGYCLWVEHGEVRRERCWHDIADAWRAAAESPGPRLPVQELRARVRVALQESVDRHLVSDVPVGVFLSGGIDSGALAGLMRERGTSDLLGVTLSYSEYSGRHEDEVPAATVIARHHGIRHHVRRVGREEFAADLPRILDAMDQPSIDGINTWYATKAVAEQGLKVVVSGVGGDELFFGYDSFRQLPRLLAAWGWSATVPGISSLGRFATRLQARRSGEARWNHAPEWLDEGIAGAWWLRRSARAPESVPGLLRAEALGGFSPSRWVAEMCGPLAADPVLALAQIESTTYLRNQLLRDSDWASMDHSVELRTPFVDAHLLSQVVDLLPQFQDHPGKTLLAKAPARALPQCIVRRRKTGFGIPVREWVNAVAGVDRSWQDLVSMTVLRSGD